MTVHIARCGNEKLSEGWQSSLWFFIEHLTNLENYTKIARLQKHTRPRTRHFEEISSHFPRDYTTNFARRLLCTYECVSCNCAAKNVSIKRNNNYLEHRYNYLRNYQDQTRLNAFFQFACPRF